MTPVACNTTRLGRGAALAAVLVSFAMPSAASAISLNQLGLADDANAACVLSAQSPSDQVSLDRVSGDALLGCADASPARPIVASVTVCVEQASFVEIYHLYYFGDGCTTRTGVIDFAGTTSVSDTLVCRSGYAPLFRTRAVVRLSMPDGSVVNLDDASDPRPNACQ